MKTKIFIQLFSVLLIAYLALEQQLTNVMNVILVFIYKVINPVLLHVQLAMSQQVGLLINAVLHLALHVILQLQINVSHVKQLIFYLQLIILHA